MILGKWWFLNLLKKLEPEYWFDYLHCYHITLQIYRPHCQYIVCSIRLISVSQLCWTKQPSPQSCETVEQVWSVLCLFLLSPQQPPNKSTTHTQWTCAVSQSVSQLWWLMTVCRTALLWPHNGDMLGNMVLWAFKTGRTKGERFFPQVEWDGLKYFILHCSFDFVKVYFLNVLMFICQPW